MKKKLFLFALPLVAMAVTGCNKKDKGGNGGDGGDKGGDTPALPAEYSLMKNWAANPSEEIYSVVENDNETKISYTDATGEKSGGWEYVARSFAFDAQHIAKFNEYKKISFTGKLHTTSGSNVVMIKVEGDAVNTYEAKFNFEEEPATYELGLSFISDWSKVKSLLFFVDRETSESGSGMMTFTKFVLSKEAVKDEYNIAKNMPAVPQDWNIYGGGDEFNVDYRWGYDTTGDITTAAEEGAIAKFSWNGKSSEWAYVSALAKGDDTHPLAASGMKRIAFKVVGTENAEVMFKFQTKSNSKAEEVKAKMTGAEQIVEVDVTKVLAAENESGEYLVAIFPAPGASGEALVGELLLKEAKFDKTEVYVEPAKNMLDFVQAFIDVPDRVDSCFAIDRHDHTQIITVNKVAVGWESIAYNMGKMEDWFNLADYSKLYAKLVSDKATHVLIKAWNSQEIWVNLSAGVPAEVEVDITATPDLEQQFLIFISTNEGDNLDPVVQIDDLKIYRAGATNVAPCNEYLIDTVNAAGEYQCSTQPDGFKIIYNKTQPGWANMETLFAYNHDYLDSIKGEVTSTVDTHVIIKPADSGANEIKLDLKAGVPQKFDRKLVKNGAWTCKFLMFICYEDVDNLNGEVSFSGMSFYASAKSVNNGDWGSIRIGNFYRADSCYQVTQNAGVINVAYNKAAAGWESMAAKVHAYGDAQDYTRVSAVLEADVNVSVLLKAYDAKEEWVSLEAGVEKTVYFETTPAQAATSNDFIVFIAAGDSAGALSGNVAIKGLALMRKGASLVASDGNVYISDMYQGSDHITAAPTANGKGVVVDYDYASTGYDAIEFYLSAFDTTKYNHYKVTVTSTVNTHVLFKPADNNANEHSEALTAGTPVEVEMDYVPMANADWACKQVIFFAIDGADALQGRITFENFQFSIK